MNSARVYQHNRYKRMTSWAVLYLLIIAAFVAAVIWQARKVDTLQFPQGQIQLTVSKAKYTVGDTIKYTIKNGLSSTINLVNNCPSQPLYVYKWESSQWVSINAKAKNTDCNKQPKTIIIQAGHTYNGSYANWPKLFNQPGIYRIVILADNYTELPYADFQVIAKPAPPPVPQVIYKPVYTPVYTPIYVNSGGGGDHSSGGHDN